MSHLFHILLLSLIVNLFATENTKPSNSLSFLNKEELYYIKNNSVIKMCNNPNWEPIEYLEEDKAKGIAIDVLAILEEKLNIKFVHVKTDSWSQSQEFLKNKKCDILPAATPTTKRKNYANFTDTYLSFKLAIITQNDKPFINGIKDVIDVTMTRKKGSGLISKLKNEYPNIKIKETTGYEESLKKVASGDVYYTVATLPVASHFISKFGLYNLHIAGYTKMIFNLSIAVRKDKVMLKDILNKTLNTISKNNINKIEKEWSQVKLTQKNELDYELLAKVLLAVLVLISFLLYRQFELKKYHNKLEIQNKKFEKMLSSTLEAIILTKDGNIIDCNTAAINMFGDLEKEKILGENVFNYVEESSKKLVQDKAKLAFTHPYEAVLVRLDNSPFPALIQASEFKTDNEYIRIITVLDLSDIKQKEKMLSQSTKMAQMGEMIGNIAHQWRQPLSVITTAATGIKLKKEYDMLSDEELFKFLDSINTNATHLSKTIDTFRNFIKEKVELKEVIIQERIDNALVFIIPSALSILSWIITSFNSR